MLERGDKSFHTNYFMNWTTRTVSTLKSKNEQNVSVQGNWIKNGYLVKQWAIIILDTPWILTVRSLKQLKAPESTHRTITFLIVLLVMTLPLYKKQNVVYCNYNTKLGIKHSFMSIYREEMNQGYMIVYKTRNGWRKQETKRIPRSMQDLKNIIMT